MLHLGDTSKTESELSAFLRSINHRFTQETYDLLNNNCNNFSDEVSRFLLGLGIPTHIVDLPRIVFSTPGGAMLRPMIEGMQQNIRMQQGGGMDPFGATPGGFSEVSLSQSINAIGAQATTAAQASSRVSSVGAPPPAVPPAAPRSLVEKPLVSSDRDPKMVRSLVAKILKVAESDGLALTEQNTQCIQEAMQTLCDAPSPVLSVFLNEAFALLGLVLERCPSLHMSCLFLMRLIALTPHGIDAATVRPVMESLLRRLSECGAARAPTPDEGLSTVPAMVMGYCTLANFVSHKQGCLALFANQGSDGEKRMGQCVDVAMWGLCHARPEVRQIGSALAYNLALASTLSEPGGEWGADATAGVTLQWRSLHVSTTYGEGADATHASAAAATALAAEEQQQQPQQQEEDDLHPHIVQLLCGSLEGVDGESDPTALRRRMLTAYRACRAGGERARELGLALGFDQVVCDVRARVPASASAVSGSGDDPHNLCAHLENFFSG
jgi:hypothetical protein